MPVRRRGDGEIVSEETQPVRRGDDDGPTKPVAERATGNAPTRRVDDTGGSLFDDDSRGDPGESLFGDDRRRGWESPTKPMRGGKTARNRPDADEGRTRVYRGSSGSQSSVAEGGDDPMADPPVGWLVVVGGPGKGRVLTLGSGMNAIGRSAESRVRLDFGDDNVSRRNHARLIYEPRQRRWLLSHGEGTNLTYLNGDVVVEVVEIEAGAEIQLGDTTMRFQPFCSKAFDWQDLDD